MIKNQKSFTLIDVLVGTFLILIVFLGIFGAYQLSLKVTGESKNKITATALANQKIEMVRNLSYKDVGVEGGEVGGVIPGQISIIANNIEYIIITTVSYVDDCADGTFLEKEECPEKKNTDTEFFNDYKKVKVRVSWSGKFGGEVILTTDIAPKGLELEKGYGALDISVFNASGQGVDIGGIDHYPPCSPSSVHISNENTGLDKCYYIINGSRRFILKKSEPAEDYKIIVQKEGFSQDRTYGTDEIANPSKPHVTILEGKLTEVSFSIDTLSTKKVDTLKPLESWEDFFDDTLKVSASLNVSISGGEVKLSLIESEYANSGFLISETIAPGNLKTWNQLSWTDNEPSNTDIKYQLLYFNGTDWVPIPGFTDFDDSPKDLSGLDSATYKEIRLKANLSTSDTGLTPTLFDWKIGWQSFLPNIAFNLRGTKIIGADENGNPVFKHSITKITDSQGKAEITDLEWDLYTITIDGAATGYDISASNPPQPVDIAPGTTVSVALTLVPHATNTLLVTVTDVNNVPLEGATTTLSKSGFAKTLLTGESGQSFFTPLSEATYDLEVSFSGYTTVTFSGEVSGQTEARIIMTQL